MLFIVWQNRHHEALLTQSNNYKLKEKVLLTLSKAMFSCDLPL